MDHDHQFAVPALPAHRSRMHPPQPQTPTPGRSWMDYEAAQSGYNPSHWSMPGGYAQARGSSRDDMMYYQGTPAPELVTKMYQQLTKESREYAWPRPGSAVPWTDTTAAGKRYEYNVNQPNPWRASSMYHSGRADLDSPTLSRRIISREDRNWLLNTSVAARQTIRGSAKPQRSQSPRRMRDADSVGLQMSDSGTHEAVASTSRLEQTPDELNLVSPNDAEGSAQTAESVPPPSTSTEDPFDMLTFGNDASEPEQLSQPVHKTPVRPSRPAIRLENWFLTLTSCRAPPSRVVKTNGEASKLNQWVWVEGFKTEDEEPIQWHSSAIATRRSANVVQTSSGSLYELVGPIDVFRTREQGFSELTANAFKDGFPDNWVDVLVDDLEEMQARKISLSASQSQPVVKGGKAAQQQVQAEASLPDMDLLNDEEPPDELRLLASDDGPQAVSPIASRKRAAVSSTKTAKKARVAPPAKENKTAAPPSKQRGREVNGADPSQVQVTPKESEQATPVRAKKPQTPSRGSSKKQRPPVKAKTPRSGPSSASASRASRVAKELLSLGRSPFGAMRAVKYAIAAAKANDLTSEQEDQPPSSPTAPTQMIPSSPGVDSPSRRSHRARKSGDAKWWVIAPGVIKTEIVDDVFTTAPSDSAAISPAANPEVVTAESSGQVPEAESPSSDKHARSRPRARKSGPKDTPEADEMAEAEPEKEQEVPEAVETDDADAQPVEAASMPLSPSQPVRKSARRRSSVLDADTVGGVEASPRRTSARKKRRAVRDSDDEAAVAG